MNVLLYAPALLLVYLTVLGLPHTFVQLSICAGVQVSSLVLLKVLLCVIKINLDFENIGIGWRFVIRAKIIFSIF